MSCPICQSVVERRDVPHVIRKCTGCGREMHIVELGEHGKGVRIRLGDQFVFPPGWLTIALNPLKGRGHVTRAGLDMLAQTFFLENLYGWEEAFAKSVAELERRTDQIVNSFPPIVGLDVNNLKDAEKIGSIMQEHRNTREFWAYWTGQFLAGARTAREQGNINEAMWAMGCAERCRAMMVFKEALEEVVWMGQSVKRIIDVLAIWDANKNNKDEEFWQITFNENSYVLSQVFAVPLVLIKDKAYVGGQNIDRSDARYVDYLFSSESSREAILIEIKTPVTPLLMSSEYRGNLPPSHELTGSVIQVLNYRGEIVRNLSTLIEGTTHRLKAFDPKCVIIIGNAQSELDGEVARRSFELFRANLKDVEIVTYDELFRKVEILAELFHLKRVNAAGTDGT